MAKEVIMPALGMAQETGTLLRWLKSPGETVVKGEPLMEIETDKATVEIEAPASGVLAGVTAQPGDEVPVGQAIAMILAPGEDAPASEARSKSLPVTASPVAARLAAEQNVDLAQVKPQGGRVQKEDVLSYLAARGEPARRMPDGRVPASPKARRLASELGLDLQAIQGSGPEGAVLAADVLAAPVPVKVEMAEPVPSPEAAPVSRMWRVMAERVTQAWTTIPHFYLIREVNASRLIAWREDAQHRMGNVTFTDLLVKIVAVALRTHPRLNASWKEGGILSNPEINIGLAIAVEEGLVVPVIHRADQAGLSQLADRRIELISKAQSGKLSVEDLSGGTFTLSNLGMYGVDAFNAIINPPQAAILSVSRIAERVVPLKGQPAVQPMLALGLSCDHRVVDGVRGARFLQTLAELIEEPLRLHE